MWSKGFALVLSPNYRLHCATQNHQINIPVFPLSLTSVCWQKTITFIIATIICLFRPFPKKKWSRVHMPGVWGRRREVSRAFRTGPQQNYR